MKKKGNQKQKIKKIPNMKEFTQIKKIIRKQNTH